MSRAWLAPIGLFLLQSAPVAVVQDTAGHHRLTFGASVGSYLDQVISCSGNVVSENRVGMTALGGEGAINIGGTKWLIANAGKVWPHPEEGTPPGGQYFGGGYGGLMVAHEGRKIGVGFGLELQPSEVHNYLDAPSGPYSESALRPLGFIRLGRATGTAFRIEGGGPAAPGTPPDLVRFGVAHKWGSTDQLGYRLDLGFSEFPMGHGQNYQAQLRLPVKTQFGVTVVGQFRPVRGGNIGVAGSWHW